MHRSQPQKEERCWELYERKNLKEQAIWKREPTSEHLMTFKTHNDAKSWIDTKGKQECIYFLTQFRRNKQTATDKTSNYSAWQPFGASEKWAYDLTRYRGWHRAGCGNFGIAHGLGKYQQKTTKPDYEFEPTPLLRPKTSSHVIVD